MRYATPRPTGPSESTLRVRRTGWWSRWKTPVKGWRLRISRECSSHSSGPTPHARAPAPASVSPWPGASSNPSAVDAKPRAGRRLALVSRSRSRREPLPPREKRSNPQGGPQGDPPLFLGASELDGAEEVHGWISRDAHISGRRRSLHLLRRRKQVWRHAGVKGHRVEGPVAAVVPDGAGGDRDDPLLTRYAVRDRVEGVGPCVRERCRGHDGAHELPVVVAADAGEHEPRPGGLCP